MMHHSRFPVRSVDVMRHTERHTDNVSESTINDLWTEAKSLNLSEVWTGTTRFQILRARLPEGYKRESGKPTKSKKTTTRPDNILPEAWTQLSQETKRKTPLQDVQKKVQNCTQRGATGKSTKSRLVTRISSRCQPKLV